MNSSRYDNSLGLHYSKINRGVNVFPDALISDPKNAYEDPEVAGKLDLRRKCEIQFEFKDESGIVSVSDCSI